ncbi:UNVERIFIED_CONTAM: Cellulose synthase-like protein G3 [Sesamum angustifolium]|uniref:Cellulose synthase-like protein G3 n=1 Tax=Sesamum angustifolium TaxID=2727405 RepID=A0AAW2NZC8_9LAMI
MIDELGCFTCSSLETLLALFYYRTTTLSHIIRTRETPLVPHLLVFISELLFTFLWVLHQAFRWRPVTRTVYPDRLPGDVKFPPVDVFICTADPSKEPSLGVMNTVISAMALDYPPDKLAVYLSDDGGSYVTLHAVREAWKFSKWWLPFCRKYELKTRCPGAYFSAGESSDGRFISCSEFMAEKKEIEKKYGEFKESLEKIVVNASSSASRDHAPIIEVMNDAVDSGQQEMPILAYVAREKRPSRPHHFKAGALNALIRVSAVISNAPYILVLDCDHYCNDPTSARQAMCYYLDPEISPKLAFVQFHQKFHNLSGHDLYDSRLNYYWRRWLGFDGLGRPSISGCNLYLKREALYGTKNIKNDIDLNHLKKSYGSSNELIRSISNKYEPRLSKDGKLTDTQAKEVERLASCDYDGLSEWGKEASLRSLLHRLRLCFLRITTQTRAKVVFYGDSLMSSLYELRMWMMKSASSYLYASLGAVLDKIGLHTAHFTLTDKAGDDEQARLYQEGRYDFQASPVLIAPICSLYIFNVVSFVVGMARIVQTKSGGEMLVQAFIPLFGVIVNYQVLEGMVLRKDRGRISASVSLLSAVIAIFVLCFGSLIFIY